MKTQGEDGPLRTKERGLDLRLPASRTVRKYVSVVKATQSVVPHGGSPGKLIRGFIRSAGHHLSPGRGQLGGEWDTGQVSWGQVCSGASHTRLLLGDVGRPLS